MSEAGRATSLLPERLRLSIGGFGGPNYLVEWTGDAVRYERWQDRGDEHAVAELQPDAAEWHQFLATPR